MAIWLALLSLCVVVFLAIYLKPRHVEGFSPEGATSAQGLTGNQGSTGNQSVTEPEGATNTFLTTQKAYADKQRVYFTETADKGILINPGLNLAGLNEAAAQPDYDLPVNKIYDISGFFMEDPENRWKEDDNKFCSNAVHPRDLPPLKPTDGVGCGWWYFEDPETASIGAIGSAIGPALPDNLPRGGTWIWSRTEAERLEDIKKCKVIKSCEFIGLENVRNECAFCADKGHGVPITSSGALKYPDSDEGSCGSGIIRDPSQCVEPEDITLVRMCGIGGRPSPDGSQRLYTAAECAALGGTHMDGDICVRPDDGTNISAECAGLNIKRTTGCPLNGLLNKECILQLAVKNNFTDTGGLVNLIRNGSNPTMMSDAMKTLRENGIDVPDVLWRGGADAAAADRAFQAITAASRRPDSEAIRAAAKYLIDGTNYNPCEIYTAGSRGPFRAECLQRAFRAAGCQAGGAAYPNERTAVSELSNLSWSQVNARFKQLYDNMKSRDSRTQDMALKNCLGAGSEFYLEKGRTCWKCADNINVPVRRNETGDIECASYNGRDCLWSSSKAGCDATLAGLNTSALRPLACGDAHKRVWGNTGYESQNGWCSVASTSGSHNSPMELANWVAVAKLGKWDQIPGWTETISVGDDNTLWSASGQRLIWFAERVSSSDPGWRSIPGRALQIDGKSRNLAIHVGVENKGTGFSLFEWRNGGWENNPGAGTWASIGSDGVIYTSTNNGDLYMDEKTGRGWQLVGRNVAQVAVGNKNNVWIVDRQQRIFRKFGGGWTPVPGQLTRVAVSGDGSKVVGVNRVDDIFAWNGRTWEQIPGKLRNISVNNTFIVGANAAGNIWFLKHTSDA
jgi:hypothetical protein